MPLTWVPSTKALAAGFPQGIDPATAYNIDDSDIPDAMWDVLATRTHRHRLNNEAASALLNAKEQAEKKGEAAPDPIAWLHAYRLEACAEIREGRVGLRVASDLIVESPLDKEANDRAFDLIAAHLNASGAKFPYTVRNARSLAWKDAEGVTMQDNIVFFLNATKRGKAVMAKARQTIADREAEKAELAGLMDPDDDAEAAE